MLETHRFMTVHDIKTGKGSLGFSGRSLSSSGGIWLASCFRLCLLVLWKCPEIDYCSEA